MRAEGLTSSLLARRLSDRLRELQAEQTAIERALAALGAAPARQEPPTSPPPRSPAPLRQAVLEALGARPGTRASMLSLVVNLPVDAVRRELEDLSRAGVVEPCRLGFRLVNASPDQ
jgi:hypothetical protein